MNETYINVHPAFTMADPEGDLQKEPQFVNLNPLSINEVY